MHTDERTGKRPVGAWMRPSGCAKVHFFVDWISLCRHRYLRMRDMSTARPFTVPEGGEGLYPDLCIKCRRRLATWKESGHG